MPAVEEREYTYLSDREIAGSGMGTSPVGIAAYRDLQRAAFADGPQDTAAAQAVAEQGVADAATADANAAAAQVTGEFAQGTADAAMTRADDAYDLANTKVTKDAGPTFAAPLATPARTALAAYAGGSGAVAYDAAEITALKAQVAILTAALAGVVLDLRSNGALTAA